MREQLWGVLFEDSGVEYLVAVEQSEGDAIAKACRFDRRSFEQVAERGEGEAPRWEGYDGMHYVARISAELAEEAEPQLARGVAVRMQ
jgi:hypothetical protein